MLILSPGGFGCRGFSLCNECGYRENYSFRRFCWPDAGLGAIGDNAFNFGFSAFLRCVSYDSRHRPALAPLRRSPGVTNDCNM
jgi:hypothetical protein